MTRESFEKFYNECKANGKGIIICLLDSKNPYNIECKNDLGKNTNIEEFLSDCIIIKRFNEKILIPYSSIKCIYEE